MLMAMTTDLPSTSIEGLPTWWMVALITALAIVGSWLLARVSRARAFAALRRWLPLALLVVWLGVVAIWLQRLIPDEGAQWLVRAAILLTLAAAALPWLRNLVHAVVFGLEDRYRVGDDLRVGAIEGRLTAIHSRVVILRASEGTEIAIPHATLAREHVVRLNIDAHDAPCELSLLAPSELDVHVAAELARTAAALSPYAAPRLEPRVFVLSDEPGAKLRVQLQGFVFDREHQLRFRSDVGARFMRMTRDYLESRDPRNPAGNPQMATER